MVHWATFVFLLVWPPSALLHRSQVTSQRRLYFLFYVLFLVYEHFLNSLETFAWGLCAYGNVIIMIAIIWLLLLSLCSVLDVSLSLPFSLFPFLKEKYLTSSIVMLISRQRGALLFFLCNCRFHCVWLCFSIHLWQPDTLSSAHFWLTPWCDLLGSTRWLMFLLKQDLKMLLLFLSLLASSLTLLLFPFATSLACRGFCRW